MTASTEASGPEELDRLCECGREIKADFSFCPACGFAVQSSGEPERQPGSICRTLCRCAERTFERLAESHLAGKALGEESFTDFNLQDIRKVHGDRVVTHQFTRDEEARNGADWEWWFHDGGHGFGMRVQAKKAHKDGRYVLRHHIGASGSSVLQSDRLVKDAAASGCLPFYVFYNHQNWTAARDEQAPADCDHTVADQRQVGCTIVSALVVQRVLVERVYRSSDHVKQQSIPWNRVLCDSVASDAGASSLEAVFDRVGALHWDGVLDLRQAVERPRTQAHVESAIESRDSAGRRTPAPPRRVVARRTDPEPSPVDLMASPVYRRFNVLADRPVPALPKRVRQMINGDVVKPADDRVAGTVLVDLADR
ncbi:DUF6615 family protein [Streptomyces sp. NPDC047976]|uniref:DUF6615 family protein n=1 Tax=Streptomyces sp. NPDC047976 TaxID=3155746 RepID=UPI0034473F92